MSLSGQAAARLYDDHVDMVYGCVARRLGAGPAVEVVAHVFEQALATYDEFVDSKMSQRGWLLGLATTAIRLHWPIERERLETWRAHRRPVATAGDPLLTKSSAPVEDPEVRAVMAAVAALDPLDRDILLLITWERCEPEVVAQALDISTGSVRAGLRRARKHLKQLVQARQTGTGTAIGTGTDGLGQ